MNEGWRRALIERGARVESAQATGFDPVQPPGKGQTALTALLSHGVLHASGQDAKAFLQGQLSNDVELISESRAEPAAYCTPKGRVLATPLLWWADEGYALGLPRELCEAIRRRLQMYVLRSRVQLAEASDRIALIGVAGPEARTIVSAELGLELSSVIDVAHGDAVTALALPGLRVLVIAESAQAVEVWDRLAHRCTVTAEEVWEARAIAAGIPTVTAATQDHFTPHMLNLDLIGAVSFDKGCYTGQEIVARTQYLGQVKRRLARFAAASSAKPGEAIHAETAIAGTVVNAARAATDRFELLAVTQTPQHNLANALQLGTGGAALEPLDLPYRVPLAESADAGD